MVYVVAHRGANEAGKKPQSYDAYMYACTYATMLEGDMRFTKDNVVVIHHDQNYNGTYDGPVASYNWATIRDKHTNADGSKVITLGALLRIAQAKGKMVSLEFKISPTNDQIKKVKGELAKYSLQSRTRVFSFSDDTIERIQRVGGIFTGINSTQPVSVAEAKDRGNAVAIDIANLTQAWVNTYHNNKIQIYTYTLNTDTEDQKAINYGAKMFGLITDRPSRTRYFLNVLA